MEIKIDSTYKGTRILYAMTAKRKRELLSSMIGICEKYGYSEIMLPIIQKAETFSAKVGEENKNMMFNFQDRGKRDLCLAPEYTAIIQQLALDRFKFENNLKLFYIGECFRGENTQAGRWRQFTQFGVEVINPKESFSEELIALSKELIELVVDDYTLNWGVTRGLDYYKDGKGFEIVCESLGSSKQVCGGGSYEGGVGFAIGVDRLLMLDKVLMA